MLETPKSNDDANRPRSWTGLGTIVDFLRRRVFGVLGAHTSSTAPDTSSHTTRRLSETLALGEYTCSGFSTATIQVRSTALTQFEYVLLQAELSRYPLHIRTALDPHLRVVVLDQAEPNEREQVDVEKVAGQLLPNNDVALYLRPNVEFYKKGMNAVDSLTHECGELIFRLCDNVDTTFCPKVQQLIRADFDAAFREIEQIFKLPQGSVSEHSLVHGIDGLDDHARRVITYWFRSNEVTAEAFRAYIMGENYIHKPAEGSGFERERTMQTLVKVRNHLFASCFDQLDKLLAKTTS